LFIWSLIPLSVAIFFASPFVHNLEREVHAKKDFRCNRGYGICHPNHAFRLLNIPKAIFISAFALQALRLQRCFPRNNAIPKTIMSVLRTFFDAINISTNISGLCPLLKKDYYHSCRKSYNCDND